VGPGSSEASLTQLPRLCPVLPVSDFSLLYPILRSIFHKVNETRAFENIKRAYKSVAARWKPEPLGGKFWPSVNVRFDLRQPKAPPVFITEAFGLSSTLRRAASFYR